MSVGWSVCHNFQKGVGSYTSMLLSEHLLKNIPIKNASFIYIHIFSTQAEFTLIKFNITFITINHSSHKGTVCPIFLEQVIQFITAVQARIEGQPVCTTI